MACIEHRTLVEPAPGVLLWRYMDFAKFMQFLDTQSLWLARGDQFEDPFEGTFTDAETEYRRFYTSRSHMSRELAADLLNKELQDLSFYGITTFVNCWRMGGEESMAMWDLYGKAGGLAIVTDVARLKKQLSSISEECVLAGVKYIDWKIPGDSVSDRLEYFCRKDKSYGHEAEMRILMADESRKQPPANASLEALARDIPRGVNVRVNVQELVSVVYVGPRERPWMRSLVESILKRYGLKIRVRSSDLLVMRPKEFASKQFAAPTGQSREI